MVPRNALFRPVSRWARGLARALLPAVLAGLWPLSSLAQPQGQGTAEPVPVESFFGRAEMAQPVLSPTGRYVAFLRTMPSGRNALLVLDLLIPQGPAVLAAYSDADIFGVHWVDEDWLVFSLTNDAAGSGEVNFAPGLFSVPRTGGGPLPLVKIRGGGGGGGPAALDRRLGPNHRLLHVPRDGSREVIVGEMTLGAGDLITLRPLRLHVQTQRLRLLDDSAPDHVNQWLFDATGQPRVAVVMAQGRMQVHWRTADAAGAAAWKLILDVDRLFTPWQPHAVDADGVLYVTHARGAAGALVLSRFDFASGKPASQPWVQVPGFDFSGDLVAEQPGARTLGVRALTEHEVTVWTDAGMKAVQAQIDGRLPGRVNRLSCRHCESVNRTVLVHSWADRDPGSFLIWQGTTQRLNLLGHTRPAIDADRMAELQLHRIKARDSLLLPVWLTLPQQAPKPGTPPPPVVVLVHGGPWVRGVTWGWHALPQFLASRGYAVLEPEFRGSTGYGGAHTSAGHKQWGQAMQDDIADALRWATEQGHVDGRRACIMGSSYGGYAALMGLVRHPELYRCGVAAAAVTDLMRLVEGSWWWSDDQSSEGRRYDLPVLVGNAKTDAEMLRQHSPVLQAARMQAPVMLVHGERDRRVPLVHARDMRRALQAEGREPEWLLFEEEGHSLRKLENQQLYARRLEAFLARHLQPAPAAQPAPAPPAKALGP